MNYIFQKMTAKDISAVARLLQANSESQQGGLYGEYPLNKVETMYQSSTNAIVALYQKILLLLFLAFLSPLFRSLQLLKLLINNFQK